MSVAQPKLRDVSAPLLHPPYPAETAAGNYSMKLDAGRITQSDTWKLSPPELRPWLLMLWLESWGRIPTATLPDDDELVAAIIGMPATTFAVHKRILMRGWQRHSDGLLYHRYLSGQVLEMLRARKAYREKKSGQRHAQHIDSLGVPGPSPTDVDVTGFEKRTSPPKPVDNSTGNGFVGHWTAVGNAIGMKARPGESALQFAERVRDKHK